MATSPKEGIKLDLEWMNRVGIGGFQNFDASLTTPKLVDKRLVYVPAKSARRSIRERHPEIAGHWYT